MRISRSIAILSMLFLSIMTLCAQDVPELIAKSFENKDSQGVSVYLDSHVQINICTNSGVYSQNQTEHILENFFRKHPELNFTLEHVGNSEKNGHYCVGSYTNGKLKYRVTYLIFPREDSKVLRNLSIIEINCKSK